MSLQHAIRSGQFSHPSLAETLKHLLCNPDASDLHLACLGVGEVLALEALAFASVAVSMYWADSLRWLTQKPLRYISR